MGKNSKYLESFVTKDIKSSRLTIDSTLILNSALSSELDERSEFPFSCLSRPTIKQFGVAPKFNIVSIDSLPAVPADKTSSIINTLPVGFAPMIFPPSP